MPYKNPCASTKTLIALLMIFATTPVIAQQAGATVDSVTQVSPGRYRITGTALASDGNLACALALASGRCMFTCGANSPRCEGGTASLSFGRFDLTDLATEPNGTIILQIFVQGNISFTKIINPSGGGGSTQWGALTNTCCPNSSLTYQVAIDGVTKTSTASSCNANPTFEGFASTTSGVKNFTARVLSSSCGNASGSGTITMVSGACYKFQLNFEGGLPVNRFGTVSCPSSAEVHTLQEDAEATPMAIFPMLPVAADGSEAPTATYQPVQR